MNVGVFARILADRFYQHVIYCDIIWLYCVIYYAIYCVILPDFCPQSLQFLDIVIVKNRIEIS